MLPSKEHPGQTWAQRRHFTTALLVSCAVNAANAQKNIVLPGTDETTHSEEKLKYEPWSQASAAAAGCQARFQAPLPAPLHATHFNGVRLADTCFYASYDPHHVYLIGDWGGVVNPPWNKSVQLVTADKRSWKHFWKHYRPFVSGVDDHAQVNVANAMTKRAQRSATAPPDYILNAGDNFYWGGITIKCGAPAYSNTDQSQQFTIGFERVYKGPGIDGKQWLGVLGNHDYGGFKVTNGWDQAIGYTWSQSAETTQRWMTPAQYYSSKVYYPDFSVDYFFVDNNVFDTFDPHEQEGHNICSIYHNDEGATCGVMGPTSLQECNGWFHKLWDAQVQWLTKGLEESKADWQIIVTHFPPEGAWGVDKWKSLAYSYGIDLIVSGHRHLQEVHYMDAHNALRPTAYVITGGGGGITSENEPRLDGHDDQYGFMDLTLTAKELRIEAISHNGVVRSSTCVRQRRPQTYNPDPSTGPSLCDDSATSIPLRRQLAADNVTLV